jgi:hypothetical protein
MTTILRITLAGTIFPSLPIYPAQSRGEKQKGKNLSLRMKRSGIKQSLSSSAIFQKGLLLPIRRNHNDKFR